MTQQDFLKHVVSVLEEMGVPYMIVGSYASGVLGEPRMTLDVDLVVSLMREDIVVLGRAFAMPDYYYDPHTAQEALATGGMFNIIHPASGNKADFIIARQDEWGRHQMFRRTKRKVFPGFEAFFASPEDVIIAKLLSYKEGESEKHLRDSAGIVREARVPIDDAYIEHWVSELSVADFWKLVLERVRMKP